METIYLDNNATTQPFPEVIAAMREMLETEWGNPSSLHRHGCRAKGRVELARRKVAEFIGAEPGEILFMSGGTEAINTAIRSALVAGVPAGRNAVVTTTIEHGAVSGLCAGLDDLGACEARWMPVNEDGVIDLERALPLIDERVAVVSVQWANNETGAIQPLEAIAAHCRAMGVLLHCDATQWIGKMPTDVSATGIDLMTFSAHKFHGPKGAGALYMRKGLRLEPMMYGSQERARRGGTENTAGCVGMGVAAEMVGAWLEDPKNRAGVAAKRDRFERSVLARVPGSRVNGPTAPGARLWNTSNIAFDLIDGEPLLLMMSERGVFASGGSACASGSVEGSPVLKAMGCTPERIGGSIRFSLSRSTTDDEIDRAVAIIAECVAYLRGDADAAVKTVKAGVPKPV